MAMNVGNITASVSALLMTMEWLEGCAADLGHDAEEAAVAHQLVRGSGGVSVSKSSPATLTARPFLSARSWLVRLHRRSADIRRSEICSALGVDRQQDGDMAPVPPTYCLELSVLLRLALGLFTGDGKPDNPWLRERGHQLAGLSNRGLSVKVRDLRRMPVSGVSCGTGVL
jgi:hypothetical protein